MHESRIVIAGGGIAAVSCVEAINACNRNETLPFITVICASQLVKAAINVELVSRVAERFDVEQRPLTWLESIYPNVQVKHAVAESVDANQQTVHCRLLNAENSAIAIKYDRLCICTGGKPRQLDRHSVANSIYSSFINTIRDTDSVRSFQRRIQTGARRVVIVGNGGIATELAYELSNKNRMNYSALEVVWIVRHKSIAATFIDAGAAEFFLQTARKSRSAASSEQLAEYNVAKRRKYTVDDNTPTVDELVHESRSESVQGSALGPDWLQHYQLAAVDPVTTNEAESKFTLHIEYECEVSRFYLPAEFKEAGLHAARVDFTLSKASDVETGKLADDTGEWPFYVQLTNGRIFGCDFVVNATGVDPQYPPVVCASAVDAGTTNTGLKIDEHDSGIFVNHRMQSSIPNIFAAGDCCTAGWKRSPHWMQMRLWTQARQMGHYAGKCMLASLSSTGDSSETEEAMDFCFEIFTHVTSFFGFKVVLLGIFNAAQQQKSETNEQKKVIVRIEPGEQYIKVILNDDDSNNDEKEGDNKKLTIQGAVLVGETNMEETLENLILNQIDVSQYGEHLLDPNIDVEDYFD